MIIIDSSVEGWQTSKINDGRWQTVADKSDHRNFASQPAQQLFARWNLQS